MFNLIDLFYPNKCPFCDAIISSSENSEHSCSSGVEKENVITQVCFDDDTFFSVAPYSYCEPVKKAIWNFKFRNHKEYAFYFGLALNKTLRSFDPNLNFDFVTSVPLSKTRLQERGYNQTELFTKRLASIIKIKYKNFLVKTKENLEQHTLPAEQRVKNVRGVYSTQKSDIIKNKNILLCDDIITTGNTIGECRRVLLESGARNVLCAAIAIVK